MTAKVVEWFRRICTLHRSRGGCMASEADCATLNLKAAIKYSSTGGNLRVLTSPMHNRSKCYAFPPSRDEHVVDVVPSGGGALRPRVEVAVDRRLSLKDTLIGIRSLCENHQPYSEIHVRYNAVRSGPPALYSRFPVEAFTRDVQRVDPRVKSVEVSVTPKELVRLGMILPETLTSGENFIKRYVWSYITRVSSITIRGTGGEKFACVVSYHDGEDVVRFTLKCTGLTLCELCNINGDFFFPPSRGDRVNVREVHVDDGFGAVIRGGIDPMSHWLNTVCEFLENPERCTLKKLYLYPGQWECGIGDLVMGRKCLMQSLLKNRSVTEVVGLRILDKDDCKSFAQLLKHNCTIAKYSKLEVRVSYELLTPVVLAARFYNSAMTSFHFSYPENMPKSLLRQVVQLQLYAQRNDIAKSRASRSVVAAAAAPS